MRTGCQRPRAMMSDAPGFHCLHRAHSSQVAGRDIWCRSAGQKVLTLFPVEHTSELDRAVVGNQLAENSHHGPV
jgi:hypothetical protein